MSRSRLIAGRRQSFHVCTIPPSRRRREMISPQSGGVHPIRTPRLLLLFLGLLLPILLIVLKKRRVRRLLLRRRSPGTPRVFIFAGRGDNGALCCGWRWCRGEASACSTGRRRKRVWVAQFSDRASLMSRGVVATAMDKTTLCFSWLAKSSETGGSGCGREATYNVPTDTRLLLRTRTRTGISVGGFLGPAGDVALDFVSDA